MASQKIQRKHRLLGLVALGFLVSSCARDLRSDSDFEPLPDVFSQEITSAEIPVQVRIETPESKRLDEILGGSLPRPNEKTIEKVELANPELEKLKAEKSVLTPSSTKSSKKPQAKSVDSKIPAKPVSFTPAKWPFGLGEEIKIRLRYGMIEGGLASMKIAAAVDLAGEKVLHITGQVTSSSMVNLFYKVDNTFDSYVTLKNFLPFRQSIRQNESSRWGQSLLTFDYKKKQAHYYQKLDRHKKSKILINRDVELPSFPQDLFGALYFYRFLEAGKNHQFPILDKWKGWNTEMNFLGREEISVPTGKFRALHYQVFPRLEGYLSAKAKVDVWLSDDEYRVILRFKSKLKFGSLTGDLESFKPGSGILLAPPELLTPSNLKSP